MPGIHNGNLLIEGIDLLFHLLLLLLKLLVQLLHLQNHSSQIFFAHVIQFRRRKLLHGAPPSKFSYQDYTTKQLSFLLFSCNLQDYLHLFITFSLALLFG